METTFEQRLIKALLRHDFFARAKAYAPEGLFEKEGRDIFRVVQTLHEKYERDLDLKDVREYMFATAKLTTAGRKLLNNVFDAIDMEAEPDKDIAFDIIRTLHKKNLAYRIGEAVADIVNGKDIPLSVIQEILEQGKEEPNQLVTTVTNDVEELLKWNDPTNRYRYGVPQMQEKLGGAGPGNLLAIFGRPDSGKSSLAGKLALGFAADGLLVDYFGNEEPGQKIQLNLIRGATGLDDGQLWANFKRGTKTYAAWDAVKNNIRVHDVVGFSVEDMKLHLSSNEGHVVIADQIDKFGIDGNYENTTQKYKDIYVYTREIAKQHNRLMINVCQASAEAEGKRSVHYSMMDGSKTGKAGELDVAIGIGSNNVVPDDMIRILCISKNKINGWKGDIELMFNPFTNQWGAPE